MAENNVAIASAVVLPEVAEDESSPSVPLKRRQSSASTSDTKRLRLDKDGETQVKAGDQPISPAESPARRRKSRDIDERKRGKRLFGALLGTLSQNSSSTAQKRRTDIEKKQQEKLKLQAEEDDEKTKQRLQRLVEERREEQKKFDEQTTELKHTNMLATAHFLQTKTEPKIYYKPWDLRPEEKTQIEIQISEAKTVLHNENSDPSHKDSRVVNKDSTPHADAPPQQGYSENGLKDTQAVGKSTDETEETSSAQDPTTNTQSDQPNDSNKVEGNRETTKDSIDEGGDDMVEGEEDAVIY